jgi:cob(I)alamin adenosyltransferase
MKIYTRGGDQGETSLFGGMRVAKDQGRIHAYGEVDELNSVIGWCSVEANGKIADLLKRESARLFSLGSHLATPPEATKAASHLPTWNAKATADLEAEIDAWDQALPELKTFILPGGCELSARVHLARAICRRVERSVVNLAQQAGQVDPALLAYLNRLSDWLFTLARYANLQASVSETPWTPPPR